MSGVTALLGAFAAAAIGATAAVGAPARHQGTVQQAAGTKLEVATTVAPITSIFANIGGSRVKLTGIVPEGTNSHTFEPKPSAAVLLSQVDAVYVNGLKLEDPTAELAKRSLKNGASVVEISKRCIAEKDWIYDFSFPKSGGKPNPHLWTDPRFALCYARVARDDFSKRDPANAAYYAANYVRFKTMIMQFDKAMRVAFATIPKRVLLTYHDAYAYFGNDYGWKVIGAIQVSDFEDPTAKEVVNLIEQVKREGVPAIFGSEVFPSPVLKQIGKEAHVRYVDTLRDDDLPGKPGTIDHSWVGLMHFDYITMTEALGGNARALKRFKVRNVAPDQASYPQ